MTNKLRARIDEQAFRELVAGRVAKLETSDGDDLTVEVILADVGWDRMVDAVTDAMVEHLTPEEIFKVIDVFARKLAR